MAGTGDCPDLRPVLAGRVSRVQVNTASGAATGRIAAFAASLGDGVRGILQYRDPGAFPTDPAVDWLYDRSAGNGILPDAWPAPAGPNPVGYAGGLGPDTVAGALAAIALRHPAGVPFWIDMETRIRDADDRLDLDLCESVLSTVYPSL